MMLQALDTVNRWRAGVVDWVSFGAVNLLQRRHPPPDNFRELWEAYAARCAGMTLEQFYAIPDTYAWPNWPTETRWRFPSPIPGDFEINNHAGFDMYPCEAGFSGAPTMVLAHGWMSVSDYGYRLWARRLNQVGWNAIFMHLPYHYSRRLPGHLHGEFAINAHLTRVAEGIRQAVTELRVLTKLLDDLGCPLIGGWGTSYGGWIMAMTACVEPRLQKLILVEPILDVQDAVWRSPASVTIRRELSRRDVSPEATQPHMRLCCPSYCQPQTPGQNVLLIAGEWDQIAPPERIRALQDCWKGAHFFCYKQGHVGYTLMPQSFRKAQEIWPGDFGEMLTEETDKSPLQSDSL